MIEKLENEVWRDIVGYEGLYQVSNIGRVKSFSWGKEKLMKSVKHKSTGYMVITLAKNSKRKQFKVHRLMALHFQQWVCENNFGYENLQVDHKNTVRDDNVLSNLTLCNKIANMNNPITREHSSIAKIGNKNGFKKGELTNGAKKALERNKKKVICLTTKKIFNSIREASDYEKYCEVNKGALARHLKRLDNREYAGYLLEDGNIIKLQWDYYEQKVVV